MHVPGVQVGHRNVASLSGTDEAAQGGERAVESHISHVAFSGDGTVMATVDVHPSAAASSAVGSALKFWDRRETGAAAGGAPLYTLNSHISEPQRCARASSSFLFVYPSDICKSEESSE